MLEIHLSGTGGTIPLPERPLTAMLVRYNGRSVLVDCGEGTQTEIARMGLSLNPIDSIFFTHFHADHIAGLVGLLLSMGNQSRTRPVTIIGPVGIGKVVRLLCVIAPDLPFELNFIEISGEEQLFSIAGLKITAFRVCHSIECYGYSIELERAGKFNPDKARALGLEPELWGRLQHGENVTLKETVITPDMVMGPQRKGIKAVYCTDSRPTDRIAHFAQNADLFICEGMYDNDESLSKAIEKQHMLMSEAAQIALSANVRRLWLTHFSPSVTEPEKEIEKLRKAFPFIEMPKRNMSIDLTFED